MSEKKLAFIVILCVVLFLGAVLFICFKIENPREETWAREYVEANIADGWGIQAIESTGKKCGLYQVTIILYNLKRLVNNEPFEMYNDIYFDSSGVVIRDNTPKEWRKDYNITAI